MMLTFFILFLIIAVRVAFLPGASDGHAYLLIPKWKALMNPTIWIMAMGQAFFSLSITGSGMIIYGSYLGKNEDIARLSAITAVLDTAAALVSGFAVIPAVFAFGLCQAFRLAPFGKQSIIPTNTISFAVADPLFLWQHI